MNEMGEAISPIAEENPHKPRYRSELKGLVMQKTGLRSDREIAQALGGYCSAVVQGIMSGRNYPSMIVQRRLCSLLGIRMSELKKIL